MSFIVVLCHFLSLLNSQKKLYIINKILLCWLGRIFFSRAFRLCSPLEKNSQHQSISQLFLITERCRFYMFDSHPFILIISIIPLEIDNSQKCVIIKMALLSRLERVPIFWFPSSTPLLLTTAGAHFSANNEATPRAKARSFGPLT